MDKWRTQLLKAPGDLRRFPIGDLDTLTDHQRDLIASGIDLLRVPCCGKLSIANTTTTLSENQYQHCRDFLSRCGLSALWDILRPHLGPSKFDSDDTIAKQNPHRDLMNLPFRFMDEFTQTCGIPMTITVQDKDPSVLWMSSVWGYAARLKHQLEHSNGRWEFSALSTEEVIKMYQKLHDSALNPRIRAFKTPININNVPYIYGTVKRKCWSDGPSRPRDGVFEDRKICKKDGHSCFRQIVSFIALPSRPVFRRISRAFNFMIDTIWDSFDFQDLSTAASEVFVAHSHLVSRPTCLRCNKTVEGGLSVKTVDAGQAYEAVKFSYVNHTIDLVCSTANRSFNFVAVSRSPKSHVFPLPSKQFLDGFATYSVDDVKTCFQHTLQMRVYRFGDRFVRQVEGMPIGGPQSFSMLKAACARREHQFKHMGGFERWARAKQVAGTPALDQTFDETLVAKRYVDDLFLASHSVCQKCLSDVVWSIYGDTISFEDNTEVHAIPHGIAVKLLDFWICFWRPGSEPIASRECLQLSPGISGHSVTTAPFHPNESYLSTGLQSKRKKFRYPPYSGPMPEQDKKVLKGILRGRIIRWEQQRTPIQQQMQALLFEFHELAHDGYPLGLIRRLWHSQSDQGPIFHVGLALLTNMAQITSSSERSVGTATLALHACTQIADQTTVFENMGYGGGKWGGKGYQNGQGEKGSWGKFGNSPYGGGGGGGGANGGAGSGMSLVRSFQNMCKDMVGLSTIVRVGEALGANGGNIGEGMDNSMLGTLQTALPGGQAAQTPPATIQNIGQPQQPPPLVTPKPFANLEEQLRASPFISGLQEEVKAIRDDVGGLGSRMTQLEQAMSSLNQAAKDIKSQNEAILARIDSLGRAPQTAQPPPDAPAP